MAETIVTAQASGETAQEEQPASTETQEGQPASAETPAEGAHTEQPEHSETAFPPFDDTAFAPQLVWLAITFVALYLLMSRVALPRIGTVIEQRRDRIASDLEEAESSRHATEKAIENYETDLAAARTRAHEIAQANRDKLTAEIDAERQKIDAEIADKTAEAEAQIRETKAAALAELNTVASDVTEAIVKELVGGRWTKAKIGAAVDSALKP